MKKYILSTLTIATFIAYFIYQQVTGTNSATFVNTSNNTALNNPTNTGAEKTNNQPVADTVIPTTNTPVKVIPTVSQPAAITPKPKPVVVVNKGQYKDGSYTGVSADAYYGYIQVQAIISGGKLTDVQFLDHPQDRNTSVRINEYAMPILRSEAIQAQSANVDGVSGATDSSGAFRDSLGSALSLAKN